MHVWEGVKEGVVLEEVSVFKQLLSYGTSTSFQTGRSPKIKSVEFSQISMFFCPKDDSTQGLNERTTGGAEGINHVPKVSYTACTAVIKHPNELACSKSYLHKHKYRASYNNI